LVKVSPRTVERLSDRKAWSRLTALYLQRQAYTSRGVLGCEGGSAQVLHVGMDGEGVVEGGAREGCGVERSWHVDKVGYAAFDSDGEVPGVTE
jgi:hypothetical protein